VSNPDPLEVWLERNCQTFLAKLFGFRKSSFCFRSFRVAGSLMCRRSTVPWRAALVSKWLIPVSCFREIAKRPFRVRLFVGPSAASCYFAFRSSLFNERWSSLISCTCHSVDKGVLPTLQIKSLKTGANDAVLRLIVQPFSTKCLI
jgi:hypothetical protein